MSLTRRLFMKSAAVAPVVGPALMGAISSGVAGNALTPFGMGMGDVCPPNTACDEPWKLKSSEDRNWASQQLAKLREELVNLNKPATPSRYDVRNITRLDPDLIAMKSFSDSRKMWIQAQRNIDLDRFYHRKSIEDRIAEFMRFGQ